jgi:pyruvate,water dikinase
LFVLYCALFLSVGIQKMVRADSGSAGVMFTCDTESGATSVCVLSAAYGLGENVVQGSVNPDEFIVHKATLQLGFPSIVWSQLGSKSLRMVYSESSMTKAGESGTKNQPVSAADAARFCLEPADVLQLTRMGVQIEAHYSRKAGHPCPMDIEFCKDGTDGSLWIVQARPETVTSRWKANEYNTYHLDHKAGNAATLLAKGTAVGAGIGVGTVRVLLSMKQSHTFRKGDVLVAERTDPGRYSGAHLLAVNLISSLWNVDGTIPSVVNCM